MGYSYDLLEALRENGYRYHYNERGHIVVNHMDNVRIKAEIIDEIAIFRNYGEVEIDSLNPLPNGLRFINDGDVHILGGFEIPYDIEFNNDGDVQIGPGSTLPEDIVFNNAGNIWLEDLEDLPENVTFNNEGNIYLPTYTKIPASTKFSEKNKDIVLNSVKNIPPEIQFHNSGILVLGKIDPRDLGGWKGNIEGISDKKLLNLMIKKELFI